MPNYGYHLARTEGSLARRFYSATLPLLVRRKVSPPRDFPFEVFSYSSESAVSEQIASIRSFLKYAGRPLRFNVMSDGTHSTRSREVLTAVDASIVIREAGDCLTPDTPQSFRAYLREHPTGKQLAVIMGLPMNGPALYIDSDVLFFAGAQSLADDLTSINAPAAYLADCQQSADDRLFRSAAEREKPVNTGVLFLRQRLDWSLGIQRFLELQGAPTFFTNQTMTQLVMHANGATPLDVRRFVLQLDDQFIQGDRYAGPDLVLRHYVQPVRHKFWTALVRHG